ncbi:uracil-DNA glycosylase family protein [Exiguobacterium sp. TDN 0502]|uniref:uracil-DNA glycosylase family protein n=1 Tax=Exiguobacterium sp. TDN 0502 TaxID=3420731 RepID=UPI003D77DBAB
MNSLTIFEQAIRDLPDDRTLRRDELWTPDFLLQQEKQLAIYYSPIGEYVNTEAKVVIIGITPGFDQMRIAFEEATDALHHGASVEETARLVKYTASFAGTMRRNLVQMLDALGLAPLLEIDTSASLFHEHQDLLHPTSLLKHPVFYREKNYSGHQPKIGRSPLLKHYAEEHFVAEINQLHHPVLLIPLGRVVEAQVRSLIHDGRIEPHHQLLSGFPHPSGANGHRKKQFEENQAYLTKQLIQYFAQ